MVTARQKILTYFSKTRMASAREISRALKMSAATVRHHLRVLLSDGRLESTSSQPREGRGRPDKVYSLPRAAWGDNLSALSDAVLLEAGAAVRMDALAKRLAGESDFTGQVMARRLNSVVEKLNQMKYHARWEAGAEGPRLIFGHCPYTAIIAKHPELCEMDLSLLTHVFAKPVARETKAELERVGDCPYRFLIR